MVVARGILFCIALALGLPTAYPQTTSPTRATPTKPEKQDDLISDQTPPHPTAEQLLKELRQRRPMVSPLSPDGRSDADADGEGRALLLPEGNAVLERSGWLRRDDDWVVFEFDPSNGEPPIRVLPNATLEIMVHAARGSSGPIQFVVSGETTVFEDSNYLLVRLARRLAAPAAKVGTGYEEPAEGQAKLRSTRSEGLPSDVRVTPPPVDDVLSRVKTPQPELDLVTPPPVDDVLNRMKAQQPELELVTPPTVADEPGSDIGGAIQSLIPDGTPLVRRPGRLLQQGRWWTIVFESDHPDHPEPPLKLLPNQNLALMIEAFEHDPLGLVFLVSGEVTRFEGENYLLARAAMRRIDPGNLRK